MRGCVGDKHRLSYHCKQRQVAKPKSLLREKSQLPRDRDGLVQGDALGERKYQIISRASTLRMALEVYVNTISMNCNF